MRCQHLISSAQHIAVESTYPIGGYHAESDLVGDDDEMGVRSVSTVEEFLNFSRYLFIGDVGIGIFIVLLIINPNMSCFGKRVSSPLYPLLRKRKQRKIKTEDYGFHLSEEEARKKTGKNQEKDEDQ